MAYLNFQPLKIDQKSKDTSQCPTPNTKHLMFHQQPPPILPETKQLKQVNTVACIIQSENGNNDCAKYTQNMRFLVAWLIFLMSATSQSLQWFEQRLLPHAYLVHKQNYPANSLHGCRWWPVLCVLYCFQFWAFSFEQTMQPPNPAGNQRDNYHRVDLCFNHWHKVWRFN